MMSRVCIGLIVVAALGGVACDKTQLLAPTESTVTLSTASSTVPLGGSTEVTAFVAESGGTPVQNGTTVRFTTNLGRVDPVEAQTKNGYAVTTFLAGDSSGVAQVRGTSGAAGGTSSTPSSGDNSGSSGSAASSTSSGNVVEITVGGAAAGTVVVTASPGSVSATGGTVTIIGVVLDGGGNRLVGVPVTFTSDAGSLSSTGATTDAAGEARVQLTTNQETVVTAYAGAKMGTTTVKVSAALKIEVAPASGTTATTFKFTVTPEQGTLPTDVTIDFGDGSMASLGPIRSATITVHQYAAPGTYNVLATQINPGGSTSTALVVLLVTATP